MVRSPVDSDTVLITLRIENDVIQDVKFKCMGCAVAIACSSMATEMVMGKPVEEAYRIKEQDVGRRVGWHPRVQNALQQSCAAGDSQGD